ncbi:MAG: tetratricopeptide repeat protein [Bacteroidetes bacterium]|nr:tetratricopeptide repeat protein [Bacteroidota bacterium]
MRVLKFIILFFITISSSFCVQANDSIANLSYQELFNKGMVFMKDKQFEVAIKYFTAATEKNPKFADAYFRRGLAKDNLGLTEEAIEDYSTAISIEEKPVFYNNRGINKAILGIYEEAIHDYNMAIELDNKYAIAYINRGYAYSEIGRLIDACKDFNKALELEHFMAPSLIEAYCNELY